MLPWRWVTQVAASQCCWCHVSMVKHQWRGPGRWQQRQWHMVATRSDGGSAGAAGTGLCTALDSKLCDFHIWGLFHVRNSLKFVIFVFIRPNYLLSFSLLKFKCFALFYSCVAIIFCHLIKTSMCVLFCPVPLPHPSLAWKLGILIIWGWVSSVIWPVHTQHSLSPSLPVPSLEGLQGEGEGLKKFGGGLGGRTSPISTYLIYVVQSTLKVVLFLPTLEVVLFSTHIPWELTFALTVPVFTIHTLFVLGLSIFFPLQLEHYFQGTGPIFPPYLRLYSNDIVNDFLPVSAKPRGLEWEMILIWLPLPLLITWGGLGGVAGRVLRPCQRAGRDKGQGTVLTCDNFTLSYVPSSMFPVLLPPKSLPLNGQSSHPFPSLLPHPDDLVVLLPPEVWVC